MNQIDLFPSIHFAIQSQNTKNKNNPIRMSEQGIESRPAVSIGRFRLSGQKPIQENTKVGEQDGENFHRKRLQLIRGRHRIQVCLFFQVYCFFQVCLFFVVFRFQTCFLKNLIALVK